MMVPGDGKSEQVPPEERVVSVHEFLGLLFGDAPWNGGMPVDNPDPAC